MADTLVLDRLSTGSRSIDGIQKLPPNMKAIAIGFNDRSSSRVVFEERQRLRAAELEKSAALIDRSTVYNNFFPTESH